MSDMRVRAAEAVTQSIKSGERSASIRAAEHLADDVVLDTGREQIAGKSAVLQRISGIWAFTPILARGAWPEPKVDGDRLTVTGTFPDLGAAPSAMNLTFSFNGDSKISHIRQETVMARSGPPEQVSEIPDYIRGQLDSALFNNTPICVAYVDENGQPVQSLRGSTVVFGPTQIGIWLRNPEGGLNRAIQKNPRLSLLYRDSPSRSTVIIQGRGHIESDPEVRRRLYEMTPEVEQLHDPGRNGVALIVDIERLQGGGPKGNFRMQREL
jgi:hypothetical protein